MKQNKLGNTGISVSEIGIGALCIGPHQNNYGIAKGGEVIKYALEHGINFIDTAEYYETYPHIKYALNNADIDYSPIISSKSLAKTYEDMKKSVSNCLNELGLQQCKTHDYSIDIFLLHEVRSHNIFDTTISDFSYRKGAWEYLKEAKQKGVIKAIGISTHHIDVARDMLNVPECDIVFPLINFKGLGIRKYDNAGSKEEMAEIINELSMKGKGIFTMKTFGGGPLIDMYCEALDYNTKLPGVHSNIIGLSSVTEVNNVIDYTEGKLPKDFKPHTDDKLIRIESGSCEGCMACMQRCPNNAIYIDKNRGIAAIDQTKCMTCGYCTPVCPVRAIIYY